MTEPADLGLRTFYTCEIGADSIEACTSVDDDKVHIFMWSEDGGASARLTREEATKFATSILDALQKQTPER